MSRWWKPKLDRSQAWSISKQFAVLNHRHDRLQKLVCGSHFVNLVLVFSICFGDEIPSWIDHKHDQFQSNLQSSIISMFDSKSSLVVGKHDCWFGVGMCCLGDYTHDQFRNNLHPRSQAWSTPKKSGVLDHVTSITSVIRIRYENIVK